MSTEADRCAECYLPVRPRQEGLQCDGCFTWQHRTCKTGILQREYREAVKEGRDIDWRCKFCTHAVDSGTLLFEIQIKLEVTIASEVLP